MMFPMNCYKGRIQFFNGKILKDGLVLAIEPMINMGTEKIRLEDDGWTFVTQDGLVSAHFEHNIAIINGEPEILSTFD